MNKRINLVLFSFLFFLSGCLNQKIIDDVQLVTAAGYELGDNEETLVATAVFPIYKPDLTVENKTYTSSAELSKVLREKINRKSPKPLVSGKIEVVLYSAELAEKGIYDIIDTFRRDPATGAKMFLAVTEGNLKKDLQTQYGESDNGMFLSDLIEHNIESGILPKTNLHLFTKAYLEEGRDPILPYLKLDDKEVNILGVALFKGDQYIDYLKGEDNFIFMLLNERKASDASFSVKLDDHGESASVFHIGSKRSYSIKNIDKDPTITITVKTEAIIQEYMGEKLTKELKRKVEKQMEEDIKKRAEKMIRMFQDLNIDPLGVGFQIKHRTRKWDNDKWKDQYPTIPIKVKAKVKISESGVIS
ncbi:Ger(x)C family spore germination protein [Sutcliffiella deserti]|uniref:Ger(x)C family spore germination protein n=1 Tax=Sutcliffiella deserti TaxID=2875501 RepID=UPI001CC19710|nr:Ger(x)C family spore germination protein [Sutcliffiella deserti]